MTNDEIREALAPFALWGAECATGDTDFTIHLQEGGQDIHILTGEDFVAAFNLYNKIGNDDMPKDQRRSPDSVWPLRGADGKPFSDRIPKEQRAPPAPQLPQHHQPKPHSPIWAGLSILILLVALIIGIFV